MTEKITRINSSVGNIEKITRQNSSDAEEFASSSQEMNAQAEQMMAFIGELATLAGGNGRG
ncbi:hypothetical protein [Desulfonema magnum]|uniref:Methyl-accepting chemotaxis protein n=1 Tax=Desulfonema magnum TaxID=45655 RepID=A0A975BVG8_9BACT|nr:hypothetical protein [Desulfonema magnum]QTA92043.1 Uncharacterized protein dnm_081170 [Desulfonema magnum]